VAWAALIMAAANRSRKTASVEVLPAVVLATIVRTMADMEAVTGNKMAIDFT